MKGLGHVQQIELLHGFNDMTSQLKTFLVFFLSTRKVHHLSTTCSKTFQLTAALISLYLRLADYLHVD
jgi:hypothetical protein